MLGYKQENHLKIISDILSQVISDNDWVKLTPKSGGRLIGQVTRKVPDGWAMRTMEIGSSIFRVGHQYETEMSLLLSMEVQLCQNQYS